MWRDAAQTASVRFTVMDSMLVRRIMKSDNPAQIAAALFKPNKVDDIEMMRRLVPMNKFKAFKGYAASEVIRDPKMLDNIDPETLGAVFSPTELADLRVMREGVELIKAPGMAALVKEGHSQMNLMKRFLLDSTPSRVEAILGQVKSNPELLKSTKAAVIDVVMDASVRNGGVNSVAYNRVMDELRDIGMLKIFDFKDQRTLVGLKKYIEFIAKSTDTGTSLAAGAQASAWRSAPGDALRGKGEALLSTLHTMLESMWVGKMFTSKAGQRWLVGTGGPRGDYNSLRLFGAALASTAQESGSTDPVR